MFVHNYKQLLTVQMFNKILKILRLHMLCKMAIRMETIKFQVQGNNLAIERCQVEPSLDKIMDMLQNTAGTQIARLEVRFHHLVRSHKDLTQLLEEVITWDIRVRWDPIRLISRTKWIWLMVSLAPIILSSIILAHMVDHSIQRMVLLEPMFLLIMEVVLLTPVLETLSCQIMIRMPLCLIQLKFIIQ